jgi:hypothetical protein
MDTYQPNPKNTVTLSLQVQERDADEWGTVSTATVHVEREAEGRQEIENCRSNWQYSGVFSASSKWRIVRG